MNKKYLTILMMGLALFAWQLTPITLSTAKAETETHDDHGHDNHGHDAQEGHAHDDGHEHEDGHDETDGDNHADDHSEEGDSHDNHGHENHEKKDSHDDHGHGGHDDHGHGGGDGHGEHEEGKVEISPDAAKLTGVQVQKAGPDTVAMTIPLTGRIILNENKTANVRARFPGFVKAVHVNLGDEVKKGQKLATIESNESLKTYSVTAPMDGVILRRETNIGDVTDGKELFAIADLSTVWAKYHIFPRDVSRIKKGQLVNVHTLDETMRQTANISMLFPTADTLSQTVIAIAELSNENGIWRPGMTIEGEVGVGEKQAGIVVPRTALQYMEDKQVIFIKSGNTYEPRFVEVGLIGTTNAEITSGLKRGESYVSAGSFVIKADILKGTAAHEH
ncbi:MAG: efflux transporter periplasmic adaptor subunit [Alphaproteobacteria bacterium]|nr:efflux transporter periplasmic adaptor subunit [Alphaproteobacteria bacterium]|tara:strand:+ start:2828 stop:4000 length:1173 start_codon:yes stop_codon:yes gene_type:complete